MSDRLHLVAFALLVAATGTASAQQRISVARPGGNNPMQRAITNLGHSEQRAAAMAELFAIGEPAVPPLVAAVAQNGATAPFALQVLAQLGGQARGAVPQLSRLIAAGPHPRQSAIELALAAIGERDSVLFADFGQDVIVEFTHDGKELRRVGYAGAWGVQPLPGDRLLVTSTNGHIAEIDWTGHEYSRIEVPGSPLAALRLLDGRTVVACWRGPCVVVLDAAGKETTRIPGLDAADVDLLWNGNLLVTSYADQRVVEVDFAGRIVTELQLPHTPMDTDVLPNGNLLITYDDAKKLVECDRAGNELRTIPIAADPEAAQLLRDGRLAVAWATGGALFAPDGKELWRYAGGQSGHVVARLAPASSPTPAPR